MSRSLFVLAAMIALTSLLAVSQNDASNADASSANAERTPPPANSAIPASFFAVDVAGKYCCSATDPWPWTGVAAEGATSFSTWRTLGSGVSWMNISPCNPTATSCSLGNSWTCNSAGRCYDWSLLDYYVNSAGKPAAQAMMFTAWGTPAWDQLVVNNCNTSANQGSCPPADLTSGDTAWKNFITDLINHEGVGKIKYLEIWNEPNQPTSWVQGSQYVTDLAQMVADGSAAAKAADSGIKVISPPVTADSGNQYTYPNCSPIDVYLSELLSAGVASHVDIIGFHGYVSLNNATYYALDAECISPLIGGVRSALKTAGIAGGKLIYDTEESWGGGQNETRIDPSEASNEESAFTGIDYLIQASNTACSSSPCYPLTGFSWFGWEFEKSTGVFWGSDAANGSSPCPAGTAAACLTNAGKAYVNVQHWLVSSTPTAPCSYNTTTHIWTCNFTRTSPSGYKSQAVWTDSPSCASGCTYNSGNGFPSYAVYYRTLTSVPSSGDIKLSPAGSATIGFTPILLENVKLN